jgi:hypothetical protein
MRLRELYDRLIKCEKEYWGIPKEKRIKCGLRQEVATLGYSGDWIIKVSAGLITKGFAGAYPIEVDKMSRLIVSELPTEITSVQELVKSIEPLIEDLENRLNKCTGDQKPEA